jgi:NAD(P)-dependent dehydrogenase (short-subunit alcohol dehydrogenase family)
VAIRFEGRVAVVTGAGAGIGRHYALELARRGARVVVNDLGVQVDGTGGSPSAAQVVADEITTAGGEAVANGDSVGDRAGAERIVEQAMDCFGSVDILINNAGILRDKTFLKMSLDDFVEVVDVHLLGSAYVTKAAFPRMKAQEYGRIGQANYGAAKMGVVGLMNCLRLEGGRHNIRVNTIVPTAATRMTEGLLPQEAAAAMSPELVVPATLYLVSADCPTGHIVFAAAGFFARIAVLQGKGVALGRTASVEEVGARYQEISDLSGAKPMDNAGDATMAAFAALTGAPTASVKGA